MKNKDVFVKATVTFLSFSLHDFNILIGKMYYYEEVICRPC